MRRTIFYRQQMFWKDIFIVEVDGKVTGTGALANFGNSDMPKFSVSNCYILTELHNHGIGKLLVTNYFIIFSIQF